MLNNTIAILTVASLAVGVIGKLVDIYIKLKNQKK